LLSFSTPLSRWFYILGDRKFGVPVLDPLFVERTSMTHAGIQATSINFTIVGVKDAELEAFR
jgi:hypothetical protein